jgi:23S rRNA pseudouridine2605 synthase
MEELPAPPAESAMQPGEVRLNKAIAGAGVCSRRQADDLIQQGLVRVNDEVVDTPGARVVPGRDRIEVRGQLLELDAAPAAFTYVMLHKPVQVVSTVRDPQGRPTVLGILPPDLRGGRLYPVGRLDYFSEGLLILTDDGDLTNRLTHPRYHLPKVYMVKVRGHVTESTLAPMRQGMTLAEGEKLAPVDVRLLQSDRQASLFEMTLRQGVNRQIRRMCRDLGLTVLLLRRVRQGPLELGELPKGAARRLTPHEVTALRRAAGLES